jgi:hypothetical protein
MSTIKMAYALHNFPDYHGDKHPWHWYYGPTIDELERTSAHASEADALEHLGTHLLHLAQQRRELAAR